MGEITDFVILYLQDENVLEEELDNMSLKLRENIQNHLYRGHGRDTGNLRDSIESDFALQSPKEGLVRARIIGTANEYGWYVNDGHRLRNNEWWEGYHFMEDGLEETVALYR